MAKKTATKPEAKANAQNGSERLALPYSAQKGSYLLEPGRLIYPVTVMEMLPNLGLLERKPSGLMAEFSGEWGKKLVSQVKDGAIVFPDNLFSRAIIYSLILESKWKIKDEAPEAVPLSERQFSSFTHSMLKRFLSCSLAQRLDAKSPDLADDLHAHVINSRSFAIVFDVLTCKAAQEQYEKGLKSGNPYKPPETIEWICHGRGRGVGVSLLQVAYMVSRISPKLAHPELISYITGMRKDDMNVHFVGRLQDIFGIFRKFGINPNGDDTTAGYVLAKAACQAANTKIKNGMEIRDYLRYLKDGSVREITVSSQGVFSKLSYRWLASSQVMFWQGIVDASRKGLYGDVQKRLGEGAGEEAVHQFAAYAGQFIFFKLRGCSELGLTQKHGLYRKIIERGLLAIHEGDTGSLKREVQTLMLLSPSIYSEWAYLRNGRDSHAYGLFRASPQLALCALGYITPSDAAKMTRSLKMDEDTFILNAGEFRKAHKRLSELLPSLSGEFRETAQEVCNRLDVNTASTIREIKARLGYVEPVPMDAWQRREQRAADFIEDSYIEAPLKNEKGNIVIIKMVIADGGHKYAVLEETSNGKTRVKRLTAAFAAREIRAKRWKPQKKASEGGP
jgi:hypothetical protein